MKAHNILITLSLFLCSIMLLLGCGNKPQAANGVDEAQDVDDFANCCCCPHFHMVLQPLGDFSQKEAKALAETLRTEMQKMNDSVPMQVDINPTKPLPAEAYSKKYGRYRANKIIQAVKPQHKTHTTVVALTHKDISTTHGGHEDWGVMGLSPRPGSSCVVSTYRIKDRRNLWKVVLHEYFHSQGLPHCPDGNPHCIMQDAHGKDTFAKKHRICRRCLN